MDSKNKIAPENKMVDGNKMTGGNKMAGGNHMAIRDMVIEVSVEIWEDLSNEVIGANESEAKGKWSSAGMQGRRETGNTREKNPRTNAIAWRDFKRPDKFASSVTCRLDSTVLCSNMPISTAHWLSAVTVEGDDWASVLQVVSHTMWTNCSNNKQAGSESPVYTTAGVNILLVSVFSLTTLLLVLATLGVPTVLYNVHHWLVISYWGCRADMLQLNIAYEARNSSYKMIGNHWLPQKIQEPRWYSG
ncbi:hypothetical protein PR048_033452 [Dryococelus australis]|uniref:Uncharacterized protein n=1 Tax=Dryococelus australis TaxID=614101 RepID=A0ABQ9G0B0_9NEOP|nr:hypothetical protein PR048_033452 [Dryococelus australis]